LNISRKTPILTLISLLLIAVFLACTATADNGQGAEDADKEECPDPNCTANAILLEYRPTYVGYTVNHSDDQIDHDLKFQFSLKTELWDDFPLYFGYTQKSFWAISEESAPFRETNFSPELFTQLKKVPAWFSGMPKIPGLHELQIGWYRHESTGEDGNGSHGWDITYLEPTFKWGDFQLIPKLWVPSVVQLFDEDDSAPDNKDIYRYYGYGNLTLTFGHGSPTYIKEPAKDGDCKHRKQNTREEKLVNHKLTLHFAPINDKISHEYTASIRADYIMDFLAGLIDKSARKMDPHVFLQIHEGYGSNLKSYNRKTNSVVVGVSIVQ
jgi:outer membrane phospholipase A